MEQCLYNHALLVKVKLESTDILEITFFLLTSPDLCYEKMLLESLTILLKMHSLIFSKSSFLFHLKNHHSKDVNYNFGWNRQAV